MYEVLTMPFAFPALGHDVSTDYRTHSVDLSAQKLSLSAPQFRKVARNVEGRDRVVNRTRALGAPERNICAVDLGLIAGIVLLIVWAVATFALDAPGWIHALLSVGVFLVIWRISAMAQRR
jgi:hypothetical protein